MPNDDGFNTAIQMSTEDEMKKIITAFLISGTIFLLALSILANPVPSDDDEDEDDCECSNVGTSVNHDSLLSILLRGLAY
jgi:hypothetical protein